MSNPFGTYIKTVDGLAIFQSSPEVLHGGDEINISASVNLIVWSIGKTYNPITGEFETTGEVGGVVAEHALFTVDSNGNVFYGAVHEPIQFGLVQYQDGGYGIFGGADFGKIFNVRIDSNLNGTSDFLSTYNHVVVYSDGSIQRVLYSPGDDNYPYVKVEIDTIDRDGNLLAPPTITNIGDSNLAADMASGLAPHVYDAGGYKPIIHCFPADTLIQTPGGKPVAIKTLSVGDAALAFDPQRSGSRPVFDSAGASVTAFCPASALLAPARVTRLFTNITDEWLVITPAEGELARAGAEAFELTVTPGHEMLDAFGRFRKAIDIVNTDARLVRADGRVVKVEYRREVYSAATAHLYEEAEILVARSEGGLALRPEVKRGWKTYNFEVETYHTYIAGGFRVHNDSLFTAVSPEATLADNIISRCGTFVGNAPFFFTFNDQGDARIDLETKELNPLINAIRPIRISKMHLNECENCEA